MSSRVYYQIAKWITLLFVVSTQLSKIAFGASAPLADFQGASGVDPGGLFIFISGTTQALIWLAICWIFISVIIRWMNNETRELPAVWMLARCTILVVGVAGMLVLF